LCALLQRNYKKISDFKSRGNLQIDDSITRKTKIEKQKINAFQVAKEKYSLDVALKKYKYIFDQLNGNE
jgi:hypothetical protein